MGWLKIQLDLSHENQCSASYFSVLVLLSSPIYIGSFGDLDVGSMYP